MDVRSKLGLDLTYHSFYNRARDTGGWPELTAQEKKTRWVLWKEEKIARWLPRWQQGVADWEQLLAARNSEAQQAAVASAAIDIEMNHIDIEMESEKCQSQPLVAKRGLSCVTNCCIAAVHPAHLASIAIVLQLPHCCNLSSPASTTPSSHVS